MRVGAGVKCGLTGAQPSGGDKCDILAQKWPEWWGNAVWKAKSRLEGIRTASG